MTAVLPFSRNLASPLEVAARNARMEAAAQAKKSRLELLNAVYAARRACPVRTVQELQRAVENLVANCPSTPGTSLHDWKQRLVDLLCDMECDGVGEEA